MKNFGKYIKRAIVITVALFVICGVAYPFLLTGIGQAVFPKQANGSIVKAEGEAVGSEVVGQKFEGDKYFHGRVSVVDYNTYTEEEKENGDYSWYQKYSQYVSGYYSWHSD